MHSHVGSHDLNLFRELVKMHITSQSYHILSPHTSRSKVLPQTAHYHTMNPLSLRAGLSVIIPSPISSHHFFPHYRINCSPGCSQCTRTRRPSCRELDHYPHECNRCTNVYNTADADLYGQFQSARQEIADLKATVESLEAHIKLAEHTHKAHEATIRRL